MKNAKQIIAPTAIIVFIFWPWLLRGVDLAWMIVFGEWLTKGVWWNARWADGDYLFWPLYGGLIVVVFCLVAYLGSESSSGTDARKGL